MQNFLGSLRSPALFNIILNIALLKNLENNTCSYILSSFYMVATGEGNFDMKMQDFWTLKSLNCRSFRGALSPWSPHQGSALDLTGDLAGPQTPRQISPPLTPKPGSAPDECTLYILYIVNNGGERALIPPPPHTHTRTLLLFLSELFAQMLFRVPLFVRLDSQYWSQISTTTFYQGSRYYQVWHKICMQYSIYIWPLTYHFV